MKNLEYWKVSLSNVLEKEDITDNKTEIYSLSKQIERLNSKV